ncbi:MAG: hypothetical protein JNK65_02090, partial [Deltaproteobacteria bacterium]|nr:hypothetical protein [Deltaproteobacteria bacterium]
MSTGQVQRPPVANSDASVITDASVTPNTAAQPNGNAPAAANPQPAQNTSQPAPAQNQAGRFSLGLYGNIGATSFGGPRHPLFSLGFGFLQTNIGLEGQMNLIRGSVGRIDLLGRVGYNGIFGQGDAIGAYHGGRVSLGLSGMLGNDSIRGGLAVFGSGIILNGRASIDDFSWPNNNQTAGGGTISGPARIEGNITRSLVIGAEGSVEFGGMTNMRTDRDTPVSLFNAGGGAYLRYQFGQDRVTQVSPNDLCDEQTFPRLRRLVRELDGEITNLRAEQTQWRDRVRQMHPN